MQKDGIKDRKYQGVLYPDSESYCYGAGVSYHIYQKPYMTKLIDCGVTTFNALLDQPTMLDREVICHIPKSGELVIII